LKPSTRRFRMDCACPIWLVGRTPSGDVVPRQSTGESDLRKAEAVCDSILREAKADPIHGVTITECVKAYLASRKDHISEKTLGQHRLVLDRLLTFCHTQNAAYMSDLTVDLLERFKVEGLPDTASTSKATWIAKLRCFLKDAYRRGWTKEALREKVTTHKAVYEEKEPYTDEEVDLILAEALKLDGGTHGYATKPKTFRLLLELQLETGIRVGDAVYYDPTGVTRGDHLWIYTYVPRKQKRTDQPKLHEVYLTDRLKTAIEECEWLSPEFPFAWGEFENPSYLPNEVYYRMQAMGERCGVDDCRPHRLRDTFSVRKLLAGFTLDDVSRLLGHSSVKITEKYYARWVRSRKTRLERLVAESLMDPLSNGGGNGKSGVRPLSRAKVGKPKNTRLGRKQTGDRLRGKTPKLS
jgi:integrase/recombinase XerD